MNIPNDYFAYCITSKDPVRIKEDVSCIFDNLNVSTKNLTYHFALSVVALASDFFDCNFSFQAQMDGSEPVVQQASLNSKDTVLAFTMLPFMLFHVGELNIFYHYDFVTLKELSDRLLTWIHEVRGQI